MGERTRLAAYPGGVPQSEHQRVLAELRECQAARDLERSEADRQTRLAQERLRELRQKSKLADDAVARCLAAEAWLAEAQAALRWLDKWLDGPGEINYVTPARDRVRAALSALGGTPEGAERGT